MGPSCYTLATHPNGWKKDNLENKHAVSTVHNTRIIQLLVVLGFQHIERVTRLRQDQEIEIYFST